MAHRGQTFGVVLILTLLLACSRAPKHCAVCQREECTGLAFRMTLENGKTVETCCPRCGLHYLASTHQQARSLQATDFTSGEWINAREAAFVSGSDVHACSHAQTVRDAQGCCLMTTYDRCLPSLVAFHDRTAAQQFQKEHGGELIAFAMLQSNPPTKETRP